jgi:MoaA/NifB/PqqE/SkfB family radical SAM enzyme
MPTRDRLEYRNTRIPLEKAAPLQAPYVIFLDPSGACNFRCKFCPCNNSDFMLKERHKIMDMHLFMKIVTDISEFKEEIKVVNLYGFGEPLLNQNIIEMVKNLRESKVCREIRITTNGWLLNYELSDLLVGTGVDMIRISIEALNERDYRDLCGVDISYQKLLDNIKNLFKISRKTKSKISIKTLNAALKNDEDANKFYDIFESFADYIYIQDTTQAWAEFDASAPKNHYEAGNIGDMMDKEKICSFPLTTMTIHSNGIVGVCPQDWKFATKYGDVKTNSLLELWNSEKLRGIRLMHLYGQRRKIPYCKDCDVCVSNDDVRSSCSVIAEKLLGQKIFAMGDLDDRYIV